MCLPRQLPLRRNPIHSATLRSQPRLREPRRNTDEKKADELIQKFSAMEKLLQNLEPFDSLGDLLATLFHNQTRGQPDPRGPTHSKSVARFLRRSMMIKMADILPLIYKHRKSYPSSKSVRAHEKDEMFSTAGPLNEIHHARPFLSTWALRLTAAEARKQIGDGTRDDPEDPDDHVQLRAKSNGRGNGQVITRHHMGHFSIRAVESKYRKRQRVPKFLTEYMSAPRVKGVFVVRERRPHPIINHSFLAIQVSAIASFIVSRNRYANGDLAMILGVWHFACKSHVDVKRVYCRIGGSVADPTSRDALISIADSSFVELREQVKAATEREQTEDCLILDNVQQYCDVYEQGIGRQSELKVGTAGTYVGLQDCEPGAFDAKDYHDRVALKQRKELTVFSLYDDIDWDHISTLQHVLPLISQMFRSPLIAKHRMRVGRKTPFQPLRTNSDRETDTQGLDRGIGDFDTQVGIDPEHDSGLLRWIRRDGATYAGVLRLTKYCAPLGKFKNKITTPEIWHTGATDLNSIAANHYGPAASSDPSSLSKCSNAAGFKRPSNIKSCDYYPTMRNLTVIWKAHVVDCWRYVFMGHILSNNSVKNRKKKHT
ncbi:hypothetical protein C8R44DRAFT_646089 [Mycena epipterygia]|nr:hypothetical protein C8R44DRAFT_646089 [Mycena epipterygia]